MKFSIRDLLLVTVIAALAVGWWVDHSQNMQLRDRLKRLVEESRSRDRESQTLIESLMVLRDSRLDLPAQLSGTRSNSGQEIIPCSTARGA